MNLKAGDTFFAPWPDRSGVKHLFFIISDPQLDSGRIVVVPLMTWDEYKEQTCVLEKGDHRFIRHRSYIDFGCAREVSAKAIGQGVQTGRFNAHDPASPKLLEKIRNAAGISDYLALGLRDILEKQDLVDPL